MDYSIFKDFGDLHEKAFPNWRLHFTYDTLDSSSFNNYSIEYKEAGDTLLNSIGNNSDHRADGIILPALFCYRHAIEVLLKGIIALDFQIELYLNNATYTDKDVKNKMYHHKLSDLWTIAHIVILKHIPNTKQSEHYSRIDYLVKEFDYQDYSSTMFRYHFKFDRTSEEFTKQTFGSGQEYVSWNIKHLKNQFNKGYSSLHNAFCTIENHLEGLMRHR